MYNPYNRYQEQSVMTMTSGEMLVKLYEETAKMLKKGISAIEQNDVIGASACLKKAQTIIKYLNFTLDRRIPISANLSALYDFFNVQISEAGARMDAMPIKDVVPMVEELGEAFAEGERILRRKQQQIPHASTGADLSLAVSG